MSLLDQWQLTFNDPFVSRVRTAIHNEALNQVNSAVPPVAALAQDLLKGTAGAHINAFVGLVGSTSGFAGKIMIGDVNNPILDTGQITDAEIVTAVQTGFPMVANLFYDATGAPKPM